MDIKKQVIEEVKKSHYFAIQFDESNDVTIVSFFFVSCAMREKQILRKNFLVALTYQDVPPGQKYFRLLTYTVL